MRYILYSLLFLNFSQAQVPAPATAQQEMAPSTKDKPLNNDIGAVEFHRETRPKSITLGMIPGEDVKKMKKDGLEFARELSKKLGVTVNLYISKNYQGLIDAMKAKKVDYAFFTAMSFVFAEKQAGAKVLLKKIWDGPFYYSVILARTDRNINSLQDLKGKKFGFVDEKSTSGYLYPRVELKKQKIDIDRDFAKIEFLGNHPDAVKALVSGKVDAISVYADNEDASRNAFTKYAPDKKGLAKVLWTSKPIPNDPFVVRNDFYEKYPQLTHQIMFAFLDFKEDPKGNLLKKYLDVEEVMMATSHQYEPVRELVRELNLKLE